MSVIIAPSILAADFAAWARRRRPWRRRRDWLHLDVMDGHSCQHHHRPGRGEACGPTYRSLRRAPDDRAGRPLPGAFRTAGADIISVIRRPGRT